MIYIKMDDFELKWRFTEEKYNLLPKDDLNKIKPLLKSSSIKSWQYWISDASHFMLINDLNQKKIDLFYGECGWGEKEYEVRNFLVSKLNLEDNTTMLFFWNQSIAVETCWGIFLKYWPDFCYPSDDSNIIIIQSHPQSIIYIEDKLWVVNRREYFGRN